MIDIDSDIKKALDVIKSEENHNIGFFTSNSPIYKGTNENINSEPYISALRDSERVLSVIGSGDQVLNSVFYGAKEIDAYDISVFPKYYLDLKIAAVRELKFSEYVNFFYGPDHFDTEVFNRLVSTLPYESKCFWEAVTKDTYPLKVFNSNLFSIWTPTEAMAMDMNPFLSQKNFSLVKERIENVRLKYIDGDIYRIGDKLDKEYDLVNLSNIGMYANKRFGDGLMIDCCERHANFVKNLRISKNGKVLNYLLDILYSNMAIIYDMIVYEDDKDFVSEYVINSSTGSSDSVVIYRKQK